MMRALLHLFLSLIFLKSCPSSVYEFFFISLSIFNSKLFLGNTICLLSVKLLEECRDEGVGLLKYFTGCFSYFHFYVALVVTSVMKGQHLQRNTSFTFYSFWGRCFFDPQKYRVTVKAGQVSYYLSSSLNRPAVLRTKSETDDELLHFVVSFHWIISLWDFHTECHSPAW